MHKKIVISIALFLGFTIVSLGQDFIKEDANLPEKSKEASWKDRIIFGGNFWFGFGNIRNIDISPMVGYMIRPRLIAGVYLFYNYYEDKYWNFKTDLYGFRPYAQVILIKNINEALNIYSLTKTSIVFQAETEFMSLNKNLTTLPIITTDADRIWVNSILLGGGIRQTAGKKSSFTFLIMWNISNYIYYPYGNPVIRVGFNF
ncbi:MAG TPA: hypothetical protein EYP69_00380 [Bacteroidales bacterium]|nr:hypothetical protein [Bacteroidales bacterium]